MRLKKRQVSSRTTGFFRLFAVSTSAVLAIGIAAAAKPARAVTVFTDRAAWEAAVMSGITTETFDNEILDADTIVLDDGTVSTVVPGLLDAGLNNVNLRTAGEYVGRVGTNLGHPPIITWTFTGPIRAWFADSRPGL